MRHVTTQRRTDRMLQINKKKTVPTLTPSKQGNEQEQQENG